MTVLSPRERVLLTLQGKEPDRPPTCARLTPPVLRMFNQKVKANIPEEYLQDKSIPTGFITDEINAVTPDDYFGWDIRHVNFKPTSKPGDFRCFFPELPAEAYFNEWGIAVIPQKNSHYVKHIGPFKTGKLDPKILDDYPFPDFMADYRHAHLEEQVSRLQNKGYAVAGFLHETVFEIAWGMTSMESFFLNLVDHPEFIEKLLDKIMELRCAMAARYSEANVDIIRLGDDVGTQKALMMSPGMWRTWLKPRLAEVIKSAKKHKPNVHIFYHTDGYVEPLIEDFIEIGIDILNPVQPECMDPAALKERYGDRLSFWGTIGTQSTMPFGTPSEVKRVVEERIRTVGRGGRLVIAPTHALQPDVPWENIETLFATVRNWRG